ncbi:hypothetical protein Lser_V15G23315 [Lactuca serriola]
MLREVEQKLEKFFMRYKELYGNESSQEERVGDVVPRDGGNDYLGAFLNVGGNLMLVENELKRYLREGVVTYTKDFDILQWWKHNNMRFPIDSRMAKDILGIQISTVASESTFNTSGRILDVYRTNLSSTIVEALVCTKDWVRKASKPIVDDIDILHDDDIACAIEEALLHGGYNNGKTTMTTDV